MSIHLRPRPKQQATSRGDLSPSSNVVELDLPNISQDDDFHQVIQKLSIYITDVIEIPSTVEQLRTTAAGNCLRSLVHHLSTTCSNPAIVNALLALKWHYAVEHEENRGLSEARSTACEIVAWRFLTRLSEREAVDYCLYELPPTAPVSSPNAAHDAEEATEVAPLLARVIPKQSQAGGSPSPPAGSSSKRFQLLQSLSRLTLSSDDALADSDPTEAFKGLNALEIAAIADAKKFLSQQIVQKIVTGIWTGKIVFWDSLSVHSTKSPRFYNRRTADPFSRLRVPRYLKSWEIIFFAGFLGLYYSVLIVRDYSRFTGAEIALFFWIAAFAYDELSEWIDAGSVFYATDIWNLFDVAMVLIGFAFAILRVIGITQHDRRLNDIAFDVLSLEALFMIPRICSILSLSPYWGTLIPCLKEMGKDFLRFTVIVVIVYGGFLTTFSLVGRHVFGLSRMAGILTKIFFGSSYVGFEIMHQIDPVFGPPLMIIFITLTSILLTGSLTGILSNSFSRVTTHAREEYLYVYSVYVLEASTSNRLTHFYPPFNLIALVIFRPLRLVFPKSYNFRTPRILLLKVTHLPVVAFIQLYELLARQAGALSDEEHGGFRGPRETKASTRRPNLPQIRPSSAYHDFHKQTPGVVESNTWPRQGPSSDTAQQPEDDTDAPSAMDVQIQELNKKIDHLTALVVAMQENRPVATPAAGPAS